jgi:hypothetical protein
MIKSMVWGLLFSFCLAGPVAAGMQRVVPASYFGQHFFYTANDLRWTGDTPTRIPESAGAWRLWDTYGTEWRYLEPARGTWRFEYLDRYVRQAEERKIDLLLTLGQTPVWASARPAEQAANKGIGNAAEPADMKDWVDYVRTVASRYKGRIKAYEIWNEPAFTETDQRAWWKSGRAGYFSGSARTMVDLTKAAAKVIHDVDPTALVVSPSMSGHYQGLRRLEAFLDAGGGEYVDVIGFHFYTVDSAMPEALPSLVARVRDVMVRRGLGAKPIWNTESGLMIQSPGQVVQALEPNGHGVLSVVMNDEVAAGMLARYLVLGLNAGLDRYYWFAWDSGSMGMLTSTKPRVVNKAGIAFATIRRWLVGAIFEGCQESGSGIWHCQLRDPHSGHRAELAWSSTGPHSVQVSMGLTYFERLLGDSGSASDNKLDKNVQLDGSPLLMKMDADPWEPGLFSLSH